VVFLTLGLLGYACQPTAAPGRPALASPAEGGSTREGGSARAGGDVADRGQSAAASGGGAAVRTPAKGRWRFAPTWPKGRFKGHRAHEDAIVKLVNELRRQRGLSPLRQDERLRVGARQHTREMIDKGYYNHSSPVAAWRQPRQRACHAGYLDPFVSENIGMISGYADPAQAMFDSWKKSPGHYRNMVDPKVTRIGVGVAATQRGGATVWIGTQLFGAKDIDFRNLGVRTRQQRVRRLRVTLRTTGGLEIKAWRGRKFAGDVPATGDGHGGSDRGTPHTFTTDLPQQIQGRVRYGFAVKVGNQTPLVCAHVDVQPGGRTRANRIAYHPLCRRILSIQADIRTRGVRQRVLTGEAKAHARKARKARFFLNERWGPPLGLKGGRWVSFSKVLPAARKVSFSLVLDGLHKEYLVLDFGRKDPFRCP
jgi:uncharacterized protein YkwD